ncbi:MAG: hypothetical protein C0417_02430 [Chlorobiaceae bacterium]|nr:hypothetical protein [Chlorobiaceae bacterium]
MYQFLYYCIVLKGLNMKRILYPGILSLLIVALSLAQFKSQSEQTSVASSLVKPMSGVGSLLGLINPDNLFMRHSLSLNYMSMGNMGVSVASYTNSLFYKISDPLNVRFDVTLQGSPFGQTQFQNSLNGVFLSRAELNYRPWENFFVKFEYNRMPMNYYGRFNPWYSPYSNSFFDEGE